MRLKQIAGRMAAVMTAVFLVAGASLTSFAASVPELDKKNTITLNLKTSSGKTYTGGEFTIYKVADAKVDDGNVVYVYTNGFEDCGIELGDLTEGTLAGRLQKVLSDTAVGTEKSVDSDGSVSFEDLDAGLYLIVNSKQSASFFRVNAFLASAPSMADDGTWSYEVDASPKVQVKAYSNPGSDSDEPEEDNPDNPESPSSPVPDVPESVSPDRPASPIPETPTTGFVEDATPEIPTTDLSSGLPKTGQLNWPVPVLATAGMLIFAVGFVLKKGSAQDAA